MTKTADDKQHPSDSGPGVEPAASKIGQIQRRRVSAAGRTKGGHALRLRQAFRQRHHLRVKAAKDRQEQTNGEAIREMRRRVAEGLSEPQDLTCLIEALYPTLKKRES